MLVLLSNDMLKKNPNNSVTISPKLVTMCHCNRWGNPNGLCFTFPNINCAYN